jgi:hypothetical protein
VPDPLLPNFDLTEDKAAKEVMRYCNAIYNPPFPLLSNAQVTFAYEHRGDLDGDVRTCASWFDPKRIAADRKITMRYCLINHDLRATGGKAAYDACMNLWARGAASRSRWRTRFRRSLGRILVARRSKPDGLMTVVRLEFVVRPPLGTGSDPGSGSFMSTTAAMTSWLGPFGPGFIGSLDENSRRYFHGISAR